MLPFLLLAPNPSNALLDSAAKAHADLHRFRAHIELNADAPLGKVQTIYDLAEDGQTFMLRIREPRQRGQDRSDRTFLFTSTKLIAYDAMADEMLTQNLAKGLSRLTRMEMELGPGSDLLKGLLDPPTLKQFLGNAKQGKWEVSKHGAETWLTGKVAGSKNKNLIAMDTQRHLLRRVEAFGSGGGSVRWAISYAPGRAIDFAPPRTARLVGAFTVAPEPPSFGSAKAEEVTRRLWNAYAKYPVGTIDVSGSSGKVKIALSGRKIREDAARVSYAYDGETLAILDRTHHRYYRGKSARSAIPDMLKGVGQSCDNLSRQLLIRRAPYREAFTARSKVRLEGKVDGTGGGTCDILSLNNGSSITTMLVRRRDGLIDSIMTTIGGAVSSNRRYRYSPLGNPAFSIPAPKGLTVLPLPKVKFAPGSLPTQQIRQF